MNSNPSTVLLHLSLIDGVGPGTIQRLLAMEKQHLSTLYAMTSGDLQHLCGITREAAQKIVKGLTNISLLEKELYALEHDKISLVTYFDNEYPELLRHIHAPPAVLYYNGILPKTENVLAVVGSREANNYGKQVIQHLIPPLVNAGWVIASGGARGADSMAHQITMETGGKTVAVLGSGLLHPYPSHIQKMFDAIIYSGGALVSIFPLRTEPFPGNFPTRNRIISGISRGCVVIQAAVQSGARITADYCLTQGREVFAVPGPIDDLLSEGCHALIAQGAKLTANAQDILAEFGQKINECADSNQQSLLPFITPLSNENSCIQDAILNACRQPSSLDELLQATEIPLIELTKLLFDLQVQGKLAQNLCGLWEKR